MESTAETESPAFPLPPARGVRATDWNPPSATGWNATIAPPAAVTAALTAPPATADHTIRSTCTRCDGRGHIQRTAPELLAESMALAGGDEPGERLVTRLLESLMEAGAGGSDAATLAADLPRLYDPDRPGSLARLDGALTAMGARHAAPSGPVKGLRSMTLDEFAQVKTMLLEALRRAVGKAWRPEYEVAWSRAYDYAAVRIMLAAQQAALGGHVAPQLTAEVSS